MSAHAPTNHHLPHPGGVGTMVLVSRAIEVRGRVHGRPDAPEGPLFDPLSHMLIRGDGPGRDRFDVLWPDTDGLRQRTGKRRPLDEALARQLRDDHQRWGASPESLASINALARGEAVCVIAGQQPAPLGGPLYALHKTAATIGLARRVAVRTGVPCVPVFWNHAEDSDFDEVHAATVGDRGLVLHDLALPESARIPGGLIGGLDAALVDPVVERALAAWTGLPGTGDLQEILRRTRAVSGDLGDLQASLWLALFGSEGLVVVDPRCQAFRAAARPVLDRYLAVAGELSAAVRAAGDLLEAEIGRRPLSDASLDSFVFEIRDGRRQKVAVAEARTMPHALFSPSVALRPAVQDAVLPTVAMACGPGEIAYLAQLGEVYAALGVLPAIPVPRLTATWLPPAALEFLTASGCEPWALVTGADAMLRRHAEAGVPEQLGQEVEQAREAVRVRLAAFAAHATAVDPSLPQMVESARGKIDFQLGRLTEGLVGKVRHRMEREHPEWARLRYYLWPGDRLQERRLASLEPVAYRGSGVVQGLCDLAEEHATGLERGEHPHYLLEL